MQVVFPRIAPLVSLALCLAALVSPAPAHASGYTLHTLYTFTATDDSSRNTDGAHPQADVTPDNQGHLFGVTPVGGAYGYGTLFEYDLASKTFTTLITFNGNNGVTPTGGVSLDGQGHLYGTTQGGGTYGSGIIFEYDLASGTLITLASLGGTNGFSARAGVTPDGQGNLYGTTEYGGSNGYGTVFKVNLSTRMLTTLVNFNVTNGSYPYAGVTLDGQGHLYGTTSQGGTGSNSGNTGFGTVFKVNLATRSLTTLVNFDYVPNGGYLYGGVALDGQGHLYGTTEYGGSNGYGMVFKLNLSTRALTTLVNFNRTNGANPTGLIALDGQGHLFGTTVRGGPGNNGYGYGTVYKFNLATHGLTTLVQLTPNDGSNPDGGVMLDGSGNLYVTTSYEGEHGSGTVFELTLNP